MRGPWSLTTSIAAFTASWRDSNYTVRASDHKNRRAIKIKIVEIRVKVLLESIFPATMALNSANHARAALASSSAA